jgi:hypothetical protein
MLQRMPMQPVRRRLQHHDVVDHWAGTSTVTHCWAALADLPATLLLLLLLTSHSCRLLSPVDKAGESS